ncbi:MAG TPA: hydroxymethylbilane synthase, partial [Acidimicrobiia bacterium]|nr:hydroxymethylbilane synthase [Acidimicrobiia bacterium]
MRIASRASRLAMAQAAWVSDRLAMEHPEISVVIVPIASTGDTDLASPLSTLSEVGAFVRAIQQALLDGRADLAVHSLKDLPIQGPAGLTVVYPPREAPADVLCGSA